MLISRKHDNKIYVILVLGVLGFLIYSNTLLSPFIFDDHWYIKSNLKIRHLENFLDFSGTRYVTFLSFAINYAVGKYNVFDYHLVNLLIHISDAVLVYLLALLTFKTPLIRRACEISGKKPDWSSIAFITSLLFISHPLETEAVTYISQRFTSLASLFYLTSLTLYIKSRFVLEDNHGKRPKGWYLCYFGSLLSACAAMKTKEISFTLPFVIMFYEFLFFHEPKTVGKKLVYLTPLLLTLLIIPFSLFTPAGGDNVTSLLRSSQLKDLTTLSRHDYLITEFRVIVTYLRLLVFPAGQSLNHYFPRFKSFFEPEVLLSFVFLSSIFLSSVFLFVRSFKRKDPYGIIISFGILWFFTTISIESSVIPILHVIFEHRVYLPSTGIFLSFATLLFLVRDAYPERSKVKPLILTTIILIVAVNSFLTFERNALWKNEIAFWQDTIRNDPENEVSYNSLGEALTRAGKYDEAVKYIKIALKLNPTFTSAYNNSGTALTESGKLDEAVKAYKEAVRLAPDNSTYLCNLGTALAKANKYDEASEYFNAAIKLGDADEVAFYNLGYIMAQKGNFDKALEYLKRAVIADPDNAEAYYGMGYVSYNLGRFTEAAGYLETALKLNPLYEGAAYMAGLCSLKLGKTDYATEYFKKTLSINPEHTLAMKALQSVKTP